MQKKPILKRWWFWLIVVVAVVGIIWGQGTDKKEALTKDVKSASTSTTNEAAPNTNSTSSPIKEEEKNKNANTKDDKTSKEWQYSFKKLALGEAYTYIELTQRGTLSPERLESAIGVIKQQAEKIIENKEKFEKLAILVEDMKTEDVKKLVLELGGELPSK